MTNVTTPCPEFEADLGALLDAELAPQRAAAVQSHVAGCEACRHQLARLARLDDVLASAPLPAVPASLFARLEARIAEADAANLRAGTARPARSPAPRRAWRVRAAGAVAAAAAALVLYLAIANRERVPNAAGPSPVQIARPQGAPVAPPIARRPEPVVSPGSPGAPSAAERPRSPAPPVPAAALAGRTVPAASAPAVGDLDALPDEDLGIALELDTVEDFEVIANLEALELLLAAEAG